MPTNRRYEREQHVAVAAVREAARLCRAVAAEISPEVLAKKDRSPVTVADFGSQALVARTLAESFPDDPIIGEEDSSELRRPESAAILDQVLRHVRDTRSAPGREAVDADTVCQWIDRGGTTEYRDRFWTVDPIDGTKGFLRKEQYAVALALVVDGQVVVGALACPGLNAVFHAVKGEGAFVASLDENADGGPNAPACIHVGDRDDPSAARFCESVESGHSAHGDAASIAERLGITLPPLRMDSQAKYAVVARGDADIYLRLPTRADYREKIWDHAAGALIVAEAGGLVTDIHGRPLEFHHGRELAANRGVVVTNGWLHDRVIAAIAALGIGRETAG
ncbi:MAG: inositol monophosphatase family protein [Isosphaeraceae bacterium]